MKTSHLPGWSFWRREYPALLVVLTIVLWLWPVIGGESTLFYRDLYLQHIGTGRLLSGESVPGRPILWDPLLNGGQPLLGNPNRFILYPSRILYRFVSAVTGLNLEIVLHLLLGAVGMYFLARRLGPGPWPAALAAYAWSLGGVSISLSNHLGRFFAFHWIPWVMLAVEGLAGEGRQRRWWVFLAATSSLEWLTGGFEVVLISGALALFWGLTRAHPNSRRTALGQIVSALVAAPLLTAFQVLPMASMVLRSGRGGSLDPSTVLFWSLHPLRLVETFLPGVLGSIDIPEVTGRYWGEHLVDKGIPYFVTLYLGVSVILLVIVAIRQYATSTFQRGLAVLVTLGVLLALGRYNPGAAWFVDTFPRLFPVRFPIKATILVALPVALLAAYGLDVLGEHENKVLMFRLASVLSLVFFTIWVLLRLKLPFAIHFLSTFFGETAPGMTEGVARSFGHVAAVCVLTALILMLPRRRLVAPALTVVAAADLLMAATGFIPMAPRWVLKKHPPVVEVVSSSTESGRFYRQPDPVPLAMRVPADKAWGKAVANLSTLSSYLGVSYGIPMVFHEDDPRLASARYAALNRKVAAMPFARRKPLLEMANVETAMWWEPVVPPWVEHPTTVPTLADVRFRIARTTFPHETVWFVPKTRWVTTTNAATDTVCEERFSPHALVVLEEPPYWPRLALGPAEPLGQFGADAPGPGWLVISIPWAPGMEVYLDQHLSVPLIADVAFMAVAATGGHHEIRVVYRPPELTIGLLISLLTVVSIAVLRRSLFR